jgi:hypothetical protein
MTLSAKLDSIREAASKRVPPDKWSIMHRATEDLRASAILAGVIKVGDRLPEFALPNGTGHTVRSTDLLARGPLVLSFFRGSW